MDKEDRLKDFLEHKCEEYLQHLVRIGTKLAKKGKLDEESFSKTFLPQKDFVMKQIREKVQEEIPKPSNEASNFDSKLIDQLREICNNFEKEFHETEPTKVNDSPLFSNASMKTAANCDSPKEWKKKPVQHAQGDSHFVSQELNFGELSKIFVQKSRVDIVRSAMDKPDFEDHLETIYVYRARPS